MNFHAKSCEDVIGELNTNIETGLSASEARERLEKNGKNELARKKPKSNLTRFFEQFKDVMIIILLVAAVISFVMACIEPITHKCSVKSQKLGIEVKCRLEIILVKNFDEAYVLCNPVIVAECYSLI